MITRRAFLAQTAAAGALHALRPASVQAQESRYQRSGGFFRLHPFIEEHPGAVFIVRTAVVDEFDNEARKAASLALARSVFLPSRSGGIPVTWKVPIKPNLTNSMFDNKGFSLEFGHGIVTSPYFVEGIIEGMTELGLSAPQFHIREVNASECFGPRGYTALCERTGADMRNTSADIRELPAEAINWRDVPDGAVHERIPYLWPVNAPETFYLNIAKFKGNIMGMTLACKNHQGTIANRYQRFCQGIQSITKYGYENLTRNVVDRMEASYRGHRRTIPLWENGYHYYGSDNTCEIWCQRTCDNLAASTMGLCIVDGVSGREGCFHRGPNAPLHNDQDFTEAREFMTNIILFGKDPVAVDLVGHWLAGHEPGNFGLFHVAIERGLSTVADPRKVPVYRWKDGTATRIPLDKFTRTPLRVNYIPHDASSYRMSNPPYSLYNEPFDYRTLDENPPPEPSEPALRVYNDITPTGSDPVVSVGYTLPSPDYARLDILERAGNRVDTLFAGYMQRGEGCTVWRTAARAPGTYTCRLRLRDAELTASISLNS